MNKDEVAVAVAAGNISGSMSKAQYKAAREHISDQYKKDRAAYKAMTGNAKHVWIEEAKGRERIAEAELKANYDPSDKHRHELSTARIEAAHAVAREQCDTLSGNARDVCRNEAKGAYLAAKADVKLAQQTVNAAARYDAKQVHPDAV